MGKQFMSSLLLVFILILPLVGCAPRAHTPPPPARIETKPPPPHPKAIWVPGHWKKTWRGKVWVPGHWK